MREVVFDIEATGLLDETTIDYTSVPYKLKPDYRIHCIVAQDVNTGEKWAFYEGPTLSFDDVKYTRLNISDWKEWVKGCKRLIGHNIIDFDMLALRLALGMDYTIYPDTVDGRECAIEDTLVMSRLLNPDRFGGHGVESWGKRLGVEKIDYQGGWEEFTPDMLYYCFRDVEVNVLIWEALKREWGDWKWGNAYQLEKAVADIITRQKHVGFCFDKELAEKSYKDLCEMMDDIERRVEPLLPPKPITKTNAKAYCPPKSQFKKDGTLSSHMEKWLEKHGGKIGEHYTQEVGTRVTKTLVIPKSVVVFGKEYRLPMCPDTPVVTEEPMKLSDQTEIKRHLISLGWNPNTWKEKDLTLGTNKRKLPEDKYREACLRYVEDTLGTEFEKYRCEHLGVEPEALYERLLSHDRGKPLKVLTSPSFTVDADKNLCPNLEALGEEVSYVKDIVKWLTYRHRRNSIFSPATDENTKKEDTGWLAHPRINIDGRIPTPANTCGAVTRRFTHKEVANIPRVTSIYGEQMRRLFRAPKLRLVLGMDFDALEARVEGHYCYKYPGGVEYAKSLISPKPNDLHTLNAKKMGVSRDDAKTLKYACVPTETTNVLTLEGWKPFDHLCVGEKVIGYDTTSKSVVVDEILATHLYKRADTITLCNGVVRLECTEDHRWWAGESFVYAGDIDEQTPILLQPYMDGHPRQTAMGGWGVVGRDKQDVFCLTTKTGTFFIDQGYGTFLTGNCTYGALPRKIGQQMGWDLAKAQQVFNDFWQASSPLADFKRDVEKYWSTKGEKKFVVAIDGAKLWSRSKHSLVNLLFQSCGVICAKRAMVWLDRKIKEENLDALQLIQMHDELQLEISQKDVKWKTFNNEEDAIAWKKEAEAKTGKIFSDVGHVGDTWYVAYHRAGELASLSAKYASEYYKLRVPLTAGYQIGRNWAETH